MRYDRHSSSSLQLLISLSVARKEHVVQESAPPPIWLDKLSILLATCGGVGFSPFAPGTLGAALGVPLALGLAMIPSSLLQVVLIVVLFLIGIPICDRAARVMQKEDPGAVIWDELVTVPVTFLFVPLETMKLPWVLLAGFALHRFFDISKIPPAKQMERLHGGTGIMLDDVVAGAYSCLCLHGLIYWIG